MGEKVSAEFLNFGVFAKQSLSQSSSPSIVGSESEHSDPLANIASAQDLPQYAATSAGRQRPVDVASRFGLEEIIDIGAREDVSEIVHSSDSEESGDLRTKSEETKVPKEPDQTPAPNVATPPPSLDRREKVALGLMTLGLPLALATMGISFAAAGGAAIPHWLELAAGLGAPGLFLALVGLAILLYSKLVPSDRPAPGSAAQLPKIGPLQEHDQKVLAADPVANADANRKFEQDKRVDLGVGIAFAVGSAGSIAGAVTYAVLFEERWPPALFGILGVSLGLPTAWPFRNYLARVGVVRQTKANLT